MTNKAAVMPALDFKDMYNTETSEMDGDCYNSTYTAVKHLYYKMYQAFPGLKDEED